MGVSLNRTEGTGLGAAERLPNGEGVKVGGGIWVREVELLRLVFGFSIGLGVDEVIGAALVVDAGEDRVGRGEEVDGSFSGIFAVFEQAEAGLLGAGLRFGLCREPVEEVGRTTLVLGLCSLAFSWSSTPDVGLLDSQLWLRTDVAVK